MLNSDTEVCVLCGEVGHIGVDCGANICFLCLETGHRFSQCGEIGDDLEDRDEDNGKEQNMPVFQQKKPFLKLRNIETLLEKPTNIKIMEIVHDDYAENVTIQFDEKMSSLKLMWKSSASMDMLMTSRNSALGVIHMEEGERVRRAPAPPTASLLFSPGEEFDAQRSLDSLLEPGVKDSKAQSTIMDWDEAGDRSLMEWQEEEEPDRVRKRKRKTNIRWSHH